MRLVVGGLVVTAALLGPVPMAAADEPPPSEPSYSQAGPQAEVSMLAVVLTAGAAIATAGSGAALAVARRRDGRSGRYPSDHR